MEHCGISTCWFQRSSSRQLIRAVKMVIKVSPAWRIFKSRPDDESMEEAISKFMDGMEAQECSGFKDLH